MSKLKLIQTYRESDNLVDWLQRLVGTVAEVENWREIGSTGNPAFENSWVNFGSPYETAAFYKDPFGIVRFKGSIKSGVSTTDALTLPVDYRPNKRLLFGSNSEGVAGATGYIVIRSDGTVQIVGVDASTHMALDNVSFRV